MSSAAPAGRKSTRFSVPDGGKERTAASKPKVAYDPEDPDAIYDPDMLAGRERVPLCFKCCVLCLAYLWCMVLIASVAVPFLLLRKHGFESACDSQCLLVQVLVPAGFLGVSLAVCCIMCCCCTVPPQEGDEELRQRSTISRMASRVLSRNSALVTYSARMSSAAGPSMRASALGNMHHAWTRTTISDRWSNRRTSDGTFGRSSASGRYSAKVGRVAPAPPAVDVGADRRVSAATSPAASPWGADGSNRRIAMG